MAAVEHPALLLTEVRRYLRDAHSDLARLKRAIAIGHDDLRRAGADPIQAKAALFELQPYIEQVQTRRPSQT